MRQAEALMLYSAAIDHLERARLLQTTRVATREDPSNQFTIAAIMLEFERLVEIIKKITQ